MEIIMKRMRFGPYGVEGQMCIGGKVVCDTLEHPTLYLPAGKYPLCLRHNKKMCRKVPTLMYNPVHRGCFPILRIGNGPFLCKDGSIVVGERRISGLVVHSAMLFDRLIERLKKAESRKEKVNLSIVNQ